MSDTVSVNNRLDPIELFKTQSYVASQNAKLTEHGAYKQTLDKDDFLKILVTQLQNQDPTAPMEDREFIAQMAQFSSLEQMTNLSAGFGKLAGVLKSAEAVGVLGKTVEIYDPIAGNVSGTVDLVERGDYPLVRVNGDMYGFEQITSVVQ